MINWDDIDTVLLDMDGTLLDLHFDNYFWFHHLPTRYAETHNVGLNDARADINKHIRELEGTLNWYCLDHWSQIMRMDVPMLKQEIRHKIKIRPFTEIFLERLNNHNKRVVLITNSHPKGLDLKLNTTKIDRWFNSIISSHQFRFPKEEQSFWNQLHKEEPFDKKRTLFIDDTPKVLKSAQDFGIQQLIRISRPDSQKPKNKDSDFFDVEHFDTILPPER